MPHVNRPAVRCQSLITPVSFIASGRWGLLVVLFESRWSLLSIGVAAQRLAIDMSTGVADGQGCFPVPCWHCRWHVMDDKGCFPAPYSIWHPFVVCFPAPCLRASDNDMCRARRSGERLLKVVYSQLVDSLAGCPADSLLSTRSLS